MTILVTGAAGFVGLNVVEHLLRAGRSVAGLGADAGWALRVTMEEAAADYLAWDEAGTEAARE